MFPIRDENPTSRLTWMTWTLVAVNLAVFAYALYLRVSLGEAASVAFIVRWAFDARALVSDPLSPATWLTAVTCMFVHAGPLHVGGNMLYLWIFGNNVEDRIGPWRFLGFYLTCGLVAIAVQTATTGLSGGPMVGASGAVAGVLGAYLLLFPRARVLTAVLIVVVVELTMLPAWLLIVIWFVIQLGSGLAGIGAAATVGGVAYFAHVGGFVAGMALIAPAWAADRRSARFRAWR